MRTTPEQLGGAKVHSTNLGRRQPMTTTSICLEEMRRLYDFLPLNNRDKAPHWPTQDDPRREELSSTR